MNKLALIALTTASLASTGLLSTGPLSAVAQGLYDPEPPANSAFVRVINAGTAELKAGIDAVAYGAVAGQNASAYRVIPQGAHKLAAGAANKEVNVLAKRFYSVIVNGSDVTVLEDPANPGQTKAGLAIYNLSKISSIALKTDDGKTTVIDGVAPGTVKSQAVNAIKVGLAAFNGTSKIAAFPAVQLERGSTYSTIVFSESKAVWVRSSTAK
jgi:alginate O-acetyltransferase complex protein AlgF